MDAPQIQYAKTKDGVNIAYWTLGEGPPLIHMPLQFSHTQLEWQLDECRRWYESLAQRRTLIRFDLRGMGMSDRDVTQVSLNTVLLDLEAVVDRLGLEKFALCGLMMTGPVAIAYAARQPERVSHLILWSAASAMADWLRSPAVQALVGLRDKDWVFYSEALARVVLGWSAGEPASRYAALIRESITREVLLSYLAMVYQIDVTDLLAEVRSPTLVLHRRQNAALAVDAAKDLAVRIPNARLTLLEGESGAPYLDDMDSVLSAIFEFLGDSVDELPVEPRPTLPEGTAIILFLDIADSTALTTKLGDAAYRERERELDTSLRQAITETGGTPVEGKVLGDGVMAVFTSARQAIDAAQRCRDLGDEAGLPLHLGIHAGDVVREGNNVHGGAVQLAARVQSAAAPGEILVSQTVRDLARTSAGVAFEDRGEHELKGIAEPQRLFAVREQQ